MNAIPDQGVFVHVTPDRKAGRMAVSLPARVLNRFFRGTKVRMVNISAGGFRALGPNDMRVGDMIWIDLPGLGYVRSQVRWCDKNEFGGAFLETRELRMRFINGLPTRAND